MELNNVTGPEVRSLVLKQEIMTASPPRHPGGRPSKLTPELMEKIVLLVRDGVPYATASRVCGICRRTRQYWMKRGEKEAERIDDGGVPDESEAVYMEFFYAADQADALAEIEDIAEIRKGLPGWRAKAWLWSRKNPESWGNKPRTGPAEEDSQPAQAPIRVVDMCDGKRFFSSPGPSFGLPPGPPHS